MSLLRGDLSVMALTDVLQWAELCSRTGTLLVRNSEAQKRIYLKAGRIFYVSSTREGERLGEYLHRSANIDMERIRAALDEARNMKIPFTQRLVKMQYLTPSKLGSAVAENARQIILDAVLRDEGEFEFRHGDLPQEVAEGTVTLDSQRILDQVLRQLAADHAGSYVKSHSFFVKHS